MAATNAFLDGNVTSAISRLHMQHFLNTVMLVWCVKAFHNLTDRKHFLQAPLFQSDRFAVSPEMCKGIHVHVSFSEGQINR